MKIAPEKRNARIIFVLAFIWFMFTIILSRCSSWTETFYPNFLDVFIGVITFIVALFISFNQWTDDLPKRLTVHFKQGDKFIYVCHEAYLSGEADIRQWAQQIGRQMNNNRNLNFKPYIDQREQVCYDEKDISIKGCRWKFIHRIYSRYLTKIPYFSNLCEYIYWLFSELKTYKLYTVTIHLEESYKYTHSKVWAIEYEDNNTKVYKSRPLKIITNENEIDQKIIEIKKQHEEESESEPKNILVNFTNHPSDGWSEEQRNQANKLFGKIHDLPFPSVEPDLNDDQLDQLVDNYFNQIIELNPKTVHIAGEPTLIYRLVNRLKAKDIRCVASTSLRISEQRDGERISRFEFQQFRDY